MPREQGYAAPTAAWALRVSRNGEAASETCQRAVRVHSENPSPSLQPAICDVAAGAAAQGAEEEEEEEEDGSMQVCACRTHPVS